MDYDFKKILEENQKLLRENLDISRKNAERIQKIQGNMRRSMIVRFIYWGIVVGIALGAFYFIRPYIQTVTDTYNQTRDYINNSGQLLNGFWGQIIGSPDDTSQ